MTMTSIRAPREGDRPLVGRQQELMQLDRALAVPRLGAARFLEIVGEPGIGKSRLLAELRARAERNGYLVLAGRASEFEREAPFKMVVEALDDHLARRLEPLHPSCASLLAALFPSLAKQGFSPADVPHAERYRLHRAVRLALEALAAPNGLVLALDDVHWADSASIELLGHLLRHPPSAPVLVALAYRPRQAHPRLRSALAGATGSVVGGGAPSHPLVERIHVGPLTIEEAEELLGCAVSRSHCRTLYLHSEGNPRYLKALARTRGDSASTVADCGEAEVSAMPPAVYGTLLAELEALPAVTQVVAQAAAVAGDPFEPELAAMIAEVDEAEALMAIDELVARDLVRPAGVRRFRYRCSLMRQVAYQTAGESWRLAAHARAAGALAARGASVVERAHHVELAARPGDQAAIRMLAEAARQTMVRAPATSAHWLAAAVRLLPDTADGSVQGDQATVRLELLMSLARALSLAGQLHDSRDTLHEVLRLLPPQPSPSRIEAATWCALAERLLGHHAESRTLLLRELAALPGDAAPQAATLQLGLASTSQMEGDIEAGCGWAEQALTEAKRLQDQPLHAMILGFLANSCCIAGRIDRAVACADEATALVDSLPDGELVPCLPALIWLAWGELTLERHDDALRHFTRGLGLAREAGHSYALPELLAGLSIAHRLLGNLSQAAAFSSDAVDAAQMLASDELHTMVLAVQSRVAVSSGDLDLALRAATEAVRTAGAARGSAAAFAFAVLGEARLATEDPAGCVQAITDAGGGLELLRLASPLRAEFAEMLVRAELAQGHASAARAWADRAEASALPGLLAPRGFALLARAHPLVATDPNAAAEHALAAATAFNKVGHRIDAGRAHLLAGTALAATGDRGRARDELDRAGQLFTDTGARGLSTQADDEQRRLGWSMPRDADRAAAGLDALSPRELEVARLVGKGQTNQQIARRLSVSRKTVETHLSRIFAKLGVSSRAAVATTVARAQIQP